MAEDNEKLICNFCDSDKISESYTLKDSERKITILKCADCNKVGLRIDKVEQ